MSFVAAGAAVGAVAGVGGALIQSNAAKKAAKTQADAARYAGDLAHQEYLQSRADLAPWRAEGEQALWQLGDQATRPATYAPYTPTEQFDRNPYALKFDTPPDPNAYRFDQSQYGFDPNAHTFNQAGYAFDASAGGFDPRQYSFDASAGGFDPQAYAFTMPKGEELLAQDPGYQFRQQQGQLALERSAAGKGTLTSGGTLKELANYSQGVASQEYANAYGRSLGLNQQQYQRGLEGNQLAYGRRLEGNQLAYGRDLEGNQLAYGRRLAGNELTYGRDLAANERTYDRALAGNALAYGRDLAANEQGYGRAQTQYGQAQQQRQLENDTAYSRRLQESQEAESRRAGAYETNYNTMMGLRTQTGNELARLAGYGQTAGSTIAGLGANASAAQGNYATQAANAQAAGGVGAANAWGGAFGAIANQGTQLAYLKYLQDAKNPATPRSTTASVAASSGYNPAIWGVD